MDEILNKTNNFVEPEATTLVASCPIHSLSLLYDLKEFYDCSCFLVMTDQGMRHRVKINSKIPKKITWSDYKVVENLDGYTISEPFPYGIPIKLLYYDDNLWLQIFGSLINYFNYLLVHKAKQNFCFLPLKFRNEALSRLVFNYNGNFTYCLYRFTVTEEKNQRFQFAQVNSLFDLMLYLVATDKSKESKKIINVCGENCKLKKKSLRSTTNIVSNILHQIYCVEGKNISRLYNMIYSIPTDKQDNQSLIDNLMSIQ